MTPAIRQQLEQIASETFQTSRDSDSGPYAAIERGIDAAYRLGQAEARVRCAQDVDRLATDMEEKAISKDADTWQRAHDEATRLREMATALRGQETP